MSTLYQDDLNAFSPPSIIIKNLMREAVSSDENTTRPSILDLGCNKGYVGKRLKARGSFHLTGIEIDSDDAAEAAKSYDSIAVIDMNDQHSLSCFLKGKTFDYILCLDILEHLTYPESTLKTIANHLGEKSKIFMSLPNVANFTVRIPLMFGRFQYSNSGILDKTHQHLYTAKTGCDLLKSCGYEVERIQYGSNHFGRIISFLPFLGTLLGYNLIYTATHKKANR